MPIRKNTIDKTIKLSIATPQHITQSKITFKKVWFNPVYFHLRKYMADDKIRRILIYGGSSAGKTHEICHALAIDGYFNNYSSIVFRKEQASIKDTIKNELKSSLHTCRMQNAYNEYEFESRCIKGNKIRLRGLDKEGKVKGLKGYKKLYFDELDHFTFKDWSEAGRRLRGEDNQQIIASWNPVSESHWIKVDYIDKIEWQDLPKQVGDNKHSKLDGNSFVKISEDGRTVLIKTTYLDNKWIVGGSVNGIEYGRIDNQVINEFVEMKSFNPADYNIYGLGNWGVITNENPFFYAYSERNFYKPEKPKLFEGQYIYLSFDFNKSPCSLVIAQRDSVTHKAQIIESMESDPNTMPGKTPLKALCQLFLKKYVDTGLVTKNKVIITGDASGKNGNANAVEAYGYYTVISEELGIKINGKTFKVPTSNPSHDLSENICNNFLNTYREGHFINYDEDLNNEIKLTYKPLKEAKDKLGLHKLDAFRYIIHLWCDFENHVRELKATAIKLNKLS